MCKHVRLTAPILLSLLTAAPALAQTAEATQSITGTSVSLSADQAVLELELSEGRMLRVRLADGRVLIDGREAGSYAAGGGLESAWRAFLRSVGEGDLAGAWSSFVNSEAATGDAAEAIRMSLAPLIAGAGSEVAARAVPAAADAQAEEAAQATTVQDVSGALAGRELVEGGLVVELSRVSNLAERLGRIGLAPSLAAVLNGDLEGPVRIVIDADAYRLPEGTNLDEMLVLVQTDAVLAGTVSGNVVIAEGALIIEPSGRIEGDVIAIDATVTNEGTIVGGLREAAHAAPVVVAPEVQRIRINQVGSSLFDHIFRGLGSLAKTIALYLLFAFVGALIVYFFRGHLEAVSDTVSYSFGRSFLTGLAAEVLFFPILLVMLVLVLPIIAIPFYIVAFALAAVLGYIAVAHAAGENLTQHRFPSWPARLRRSNSYYYVLNGLGVLLALFAGAAVTEMANPLLGWAHGLLIASAWILTWVASTAGLGAALLSRAGKRRTYARPTQIPELRVDTLAQELEPLERRAEARRRPRNESDEL